MKHFGPSTQVLGEPANSLVGFSLQGLKLFSICCSFYLVAGEPLPRKPGSHDRKLVTCLSPLFCSMTRAQRKAPVITSIQGLRHSILLYAPFGYLKVIGVFLNSDEVTASVTRCYAGCSATHRVV